MFFSFFSLFFSFFAKALVWVVEVKPIIRCVGRENEWERESGSMSGLSCILLALFTKRRLLIRVCIQQVYLTGKCFIICCLWNRWLIVHPSPSVPFSYDPCLPASSILLCLPSLSPCGFRSDGNHVLGNALAKGGCVSVQMKSVRRCSRTVTVTAVRRAVRHCQARCCNLSKKDHEDVMQTWPVTERKDWHKWRQSMTGRK